MSCFLRGWSKEVKRIFAIEAGDLLDLVKAFFCFRDHFQFCPHLFIDFRQIVDRLTIDFQCLADWDILFSYFHTITGYRLHFLLL